MITCNIYQDLILLYVSGECCEDTKGLVQEHLKQCDKCKSYYNQLSNPFPELDSAKETESELDLEDNKYKADAFFYGKKSDMVKTRQNASKKEELEVVRKVSHKLKKKWFISLIAGVMAVIVTVGIVFLSVNQVRGDGICFTSMDERYYAKAFLKAVQKKNYEKAFSLIDVEAMYCEIKNEDIEMGANEENDTELQAQQDLMSACAVYYEEMGFEAYKNLIREEFLKQMQEMEAKGIEIRQISISNSYRNIRNEKEEGWQVEATVKTAGEGSGRLILMTYGSQLRVSGSIAIEGEVQVLLDYLRVSADPAGFYEKAYSSE